MEILPTSPIAQTNVDTIGVMQNAQRAIEQSTLIIVFLTLTVIHLYVVSPCCSMTFSMRMLVAYRYEGNGGVKILY